MIRNNNNIIVKTLKEMLLEQEPPAKAAIETDNAAVREFIDKMVVEHSYDREALDAILARGAAHAREAGTPTLDSAYKALGLVRG